MNHQLDNPKHALSSLESAVTSLLEETIQDKPKFKRICIVRTEYAIETASGKLTFPFRRLSESLCQQGFDVEIICLGPKDATFESAGVRIHTIDFHPATPQDKNLEWLPFNNYCAQLSQSIWNRFRQISLNNHFDIIDLPAFIWTGDALSGTTGSAIVMRSQTELVPESLEPTHQQFDYLLLQFLQQAALPYAHGVVSKEQSEGTAFYNAIENQIVHYDNMLESYAQSHLTEQIQPILPPNDSKTIFFGNWFQSEYGWQALFSAIPQIVEKFPAVRFLMITQHNTDNNDATLTKMKSLLSKRYSKNIWHLRKRTPADVPWCLKLADIVMLPPQPADTNNPDFGLEALASGTPLILFNNHKLSPLVEKYSCGVTINEPTANAIADAILKLLNTSDELESMQKRSLTAILQTHRYSTTDVLSVYNAAYANLETATDKLSQHKPISRTELFTAFNKLLTDIQYRSSLVYRTRYQYQKLLRYLNVYLFQGFRRGSRP